MYKVLQADELINAEQLNELLADGWRLVTIVSALNSFYYYFERI